MVRVVRKAGYFDWLFHQRCSLFDKFNCGKWLYFIGAWARALRYSLLELIEPEATGRQTEVDGENCSCG